MSYELVINDPIFNRYNNTVRLKRLPISDLTVDQYLYKSIISQQLSVKAAETIYTRFIDLYKAQPTPHHIQSTPFQQMREAGLSTRKVEYVKEIATFFTDRPANKDTYEELSDDEIIQLLTQIKGVGEWTVHMLLIFYLHRPDVLALGDLIVRQQLAKLFNVEPTKDHLPYLLNEVERFRPYRSYISRLMWAINDLD